jgi:hypothetical protein
MELKEETNTKVNVPQGQQESGPKQVTVACYLILAAYLLGYLYSTFVYIVNWNNVSVPLLTIGGFTAIYALLILVTLKIYQGRNWARWLFVIGFIITSIGLPNKILTYSTNYLAIAFNIGPWLLEFLALMLLFQEQSRVWFQMNSQSK